MNAVEWILVIGCWLLIPGVLVMKARLDRREAQAEAELQRRLKELFREGRQP